MAVVVTGRVELASGEALEPLVRAEELAGADQLVVARERGVARRGRLHRARPELARGQGRGVLQRVCRRGVRPVVGEARVLRPDPGVDHADHDTLAGDAGRPCVAPAGEPEEVAEVVVARDAGARAALGVADPAEPAVRVEPGVDRRVVALRAARRVRVVGRRGGAVQLVGEHHRDLRVVGEGDRLVVGQLRREAVDGVRVVLDLRRRADALLGEHLVVGLLDRRLRRRRGRRAELPGGERLDERLVLHHDDVAARRAVCHRLGALRAAAAVDGVTGTSDADAAERGEGECSRARQRHEPLHNTTLFREAAAAARASSPECRPVSAAAAPLRPLAGRKVVRKVRSRQGPRWNCSTG